MPLVSPCFSEACRDPSTWPELHVTLDDFPTEALWRNFLAWLAVRAAGLQAFVLKGDNRLETMNSRPAQTDPEWVRLQP